MSSRLFPLALSAAILLGFGACKKAPPAPPPITSAQPAAERAEREQLFGADAVAAEVRWQNGLGYRILDPGTPPRPGLGTTVRLRYTGRLKDGTVFDQSQQPAEFRIGSTITGLSTGLQMLGTGGRAVFFIPPSQGYGARKVMGIPPNSPLIFEVEVVEIVP